jgi:hypothetical protein
MADTNEVTFVIEGTGKKGADNSLTGITFTKIKIGEDEKEINDTAADHENAKIALSELLSNPAVKGIASVVPTGGPTNETTVDPSGEMGGGSSHRRKSYKKEKKIKGGKRKSMRRHKHV